VAFGSRGRKEEQGEEGRREKKREEEKEKGEKEMGKKEKEKRRGGKKENGEKRKKEKNDACRRNSRRRPWPVGHARVTLARCARRKRGKIASAPIVAATAVGRPCACVIRALRETKRIAPALIAEKRSRGRRTAERCGTGVKLGF
jgi:hypothetical protein